MRFAIVVTGPAYGTQQASSAFQFAQALIAEDWGWLRQTFRRDLP